MTRRIYVFDKKQGKVVPMEERQDIIHANAAHGYIPDEMEATRHPVDGHYYTSKAKFREVTRANGFEEVGNAYEKGFDPGASERKTRDREFRENFRKNLGDRYNGWRRD